MLSSAVVATRTGAPRYAALLHPIGSILRRGIIARGGAIASHEMFEE
ncbi:MAG: hypothetical protein WBV82_11365 [Myxococcaceae bacterium]